jgi:hypothetical protein
MKAGVTDDNIAALECALARIPLKAGYSPKR